MRTIRTVYLDAEVAEAAARLGINISEVCRLALETAVGMDAEKGMKGEQKLSVLEAEINKAKLSTQRLEARRALMLKAREREAAKYDKRVVVKQG